MNSNQCLALFRQKQIFRSNRLEDLQKQENRDFFIQLVNARIRFTNSNFPTPKSIEEYLDQPMFLNRNTKLGFSSDNISIGPFQKKTQTGGSWEYGISRAIEERACENSRVQLKKKWNSQLCSRINLVLVFDLKISKGYHKTLQNFQGWKLVFSRISKGKITNLKIPGVFFKKAYPQLPCLGFSEITLSIPPRNISDKFTTIRDICKFPLGFPISKHKRICKLIMDFDWEHLPRANNLQKSLLKPFYYNNKSSRKVKDFQKPSNKEIYFVLQPNSTKYNKPFKSVSFSFNLNFLEGHHILSSEI